MGFIGAFGTGPTTFWLPSGAPHVAVLMTSHLMPVCLYVQQCLTQLCTCSSVPCYLACDIGLQALRACDLEVQHWHDIRPRLRAGRLAPADSAGLCAQ